MLGSCRLNNKSMRNVRRSEVYQAVAIDLAMLGVISKEECEMLLGSGIPEGIVLPNGEAGQIVSEKNLPEQPAFIQTEPEPDQTLVPDADQTTDQTPVPDAEPEGPVTMGEETEPTGLEPEVVNGVDGEIVNSESDVSPVDDNKPDVQPEPIPGVTEMPGDEVQEPVNDEGRTESNN